MKKNHNSFQLWSSKVGTNVVLPKIAFWDSFGNSEIGQKGAKVVNTYLDNFEAEIVKVKVLQAEFGWIFFCKHKKF